MISLLNPRFQFKHWVEWPLAIRFPLVQPYLPPAGGAKICGYPDLVVYQTALADVQESSFAVNSDVICSCSLQGQQ